MVIMQKDLVLALSFIKGIGNSRFIKFVDYVTGAYGMESSLSYDDIRDAGSKLRIKNLEELTAEEFTRCKDSAARIIEESQRQSVSFITFEDPSYPRELMDAVDDKGRCSPPSILWYRGDISKLSMDCCAVIGTREPTREGVDAGMFLGEFLAKNGINVVSGLAKGCDTAAHQGALKSRGVTTAFLSTGLDWDSVYPRENQNLARRIVDGGGLLLSEYFVGHKTGRFEFVARDRLQAGVSSAVFVLQSTYNGGSMHAARAALKSRRLCYVLSYKNDRINRDPVTSGNRELLKEGALMITGLDVKEHSAELLKKLKTKTAGAEDDKQVKDKVEGDGPDKEYQLFQ
jgi:DNA processing protein